MTAKVQAAVVVFPGSNGDRDLNETLARAGFAVRMLDAREAVPPDVQLVGLPGGFAFGDYWRAGMLASQGVAVQSLRQVIERGGLVIGICNGFQILVEGGYLPGGLRYNDPPGFRHTWVDVTVTPAAAKSRWFSYLTEGTTMRMPRAHGEGNYFHPDGEEAVRQSAPLTYVNNPNGSMADAAAMLDATGQVLGVMPHPERASDPDLGSDDGLALFRSAHRALDMARQGGLS